MKKNAITIIVLLFLSIFAILPFFNSGFFVSDDGDWMIIRFSAFYTALKDGQLPVRFLHFLNSGYGYPVPTFLYPGYMYFAAPIQIITSDFVNTIKLVFVISLLGSTFFTYLWLNKIFSKIASIFGSIISLYLPYHLYDVYTRGSLGEIFALMWVPFILWSMEKKNILLTSIGIALLIISHNSLAALFLPIILFYAILKLKSLNFNKLIISLFPIILFSFGLSAFFTIPAIYELKFTQFLKTSISNPLIYFADLKLIGLVSIFIFINSIFLLHSIIWKKTNKSTSLSYKRNIVKYLIFFLFLSGFSIFLSTSASKFIWEIIPSSWIQFPFRVLSYLIICLSFLAAFSISLIKGARLIIMILVTTFLLIYSAHPFVYPKKQTNFSDIYYYTNQATTTVQDEYMPKWVKQKPLKSAEKKVEVIKGEGEIKNIVYNNKKIIFSSEIKQEAIVQVNTIYWPGWEVFVNGEKENIEYLNSNGFMNISLNKGYNNVVIEFFETPLRIFSDMISIVSLLILVIYFCGRIKFNKQKT